VSTKRVQVRATLPEVTAEGPKIVVAKPMKKELRDIWDEIGRTQRSIRVIDKDLTFIYVVLGGFFFLTFLITFLGADDGSRHN
jgi:hypothetical protein